MKGHKVPKHVKDEWRKNKTQVINPYKARSTYYKEN